MKKHNEHVQNWKQCQCSKHIRSYVCDMNEPISSTGLHPFCRSTLCAKRCDFGCLVTSGTTETPWIKGWNWHSIIWRAMHLSMDLSLDFFQLFYPHKLWCIPLFFYLCGRVSVRLKLWWKTLFENIPEYIVHVCWVSVLHKTCWMKLLNHLEFTRN